MVSTLQQSINFVARTHISDLKNAFYNLLTFGMFYVVCRLSKRMEIILKTSPAILSEANCVLLEDQYGQYQIVMVKRIPTRNTLVLSRYIKDHCCTILDTCYGRFIYDYKLDKFVIPSYIFNVKKSFDDVYQSYIMKSKEEERTENYEKTIIFGKNELGMQIPELSEIFLNQLFDPLVLWEIISLIIWISINYIIYASVASIIFTAMFVIEINREIKNRNALLRSLRVSNVRALREGAFRSVPECDILPGDIVYIDTTDNFTCDVEILKGDVITDESFLTGEAVPICKGIGSIVYSGTKVIKSTSSSVSLNNTKLEKLVRVKNLTRSKASSFVAPVSSFDQTDNSAIGIVLKTGKKN
ncbi:HAD ATPase, P-type, family IC [Vittaforma corneae ATCC 50505]|uniref:Cation-transporting ATPase n=1 Tax=Vittaforma corneae (strain ATCC 50505) TaxID=993615 RepID=L2GMN0_VITCO|nr:HAD ATPase, P-type, family IC [Vittaforma corneae ATCC 50505]ELA41562.1 HAD ATPase, P-type, family IC [Vittaforma corneae ATCC 50505]